MLNKLPRTEKADAAYKNPDNDSRGPWKAGDYTCNKTASERPNLYYPIVNPHTQEEIYPNKSRVWGVSKTVHEEHVKDNRVYWGDKGSQSKPSYKRFLSEVGGMICTSWWDWRECGHTDEAKKQMLDMFHDEALTFQTPKPTRLINRILQLSTTNSDLILDFFAGTCTTAQAVMELNRADGGNRQFIMVQLPEPTNNPQYPTIAEIGKERIRRSIAKLNAETGNLTRTEAEDLGFKVFRLTKPNIRPWHSDASDDIEAYKEKLNLFVDVLAEGWTAANVLWEIALREGYSLNTTFATKTIACGTGSVVLHEVTDPDKEPPQMLTVCLEETIPSDLAKHYPLSQDHILVCRDKALDDTGAANLALQCRLKTI